MNGIAPLEPVEPAESICRYFGGKRNLAKLIAARIEAVPHRCYAEPFVGMGGVFFRRRLRPRAELINDISRDVVNLFRCAAAHPEELGRQFDGMLNSRDEYQRQLKTDPETLTDIQRASRFLFVLYHSFASKPAGNTSGNFAPGTTGNPYSGWANLPKRIAAAHRRLQGVQIERLDWGAFIRRYDRPHTLFYLDPPYWDHEADYGAGVFAREDFAAMADLLAGIEGRFILSLNDTPEVRETFAAFDFEDVGVRYSASGKFAGRAHPRGAELLISN